MGLNVLLNVKSIVKEEEMKNPTDTNNVGTMIRIMMYASNSPKVQ